MSDIIERLQQRIDWDFDPITAEVITAAIAFISEEQRKSDELRLNNKWLKEDNVRLGDEAKRFAAYAEQLKQKNEAMAAYIAGDPIEVARPGYDDPLVWRPWVANTPTSKPLFDGPCVFRAALSIPSAPVDERESLRAAQARRVLPLIGPLLDAWEGATNEDYIAVLEPYLSRINDAMEADGEADCGNGVGNPKLPDEIELVVGRYGAACVALGIAEKGPESVKAAKLMDAAADEVRRTLGRFIKADSFTSQGNAQ